MDFKYKRLKVVYMKRARSMLGLVGHFIYLFIWLEIKGTLKHKNRMQLTLNWILY
jgi:hypothetical protein